MKLFVFRNATLEPFFPRKETEFSGYGDVSRVPEEAENFLWFYTFPPGASSGEAAALAQDFFAKLKLALAGVPAGTPFYATFLCPPPAKLRLVAGDKNFQRAAEEFNSALRELARSRDNVRCVGVPAAILQDVDWRFFFSAQVPFSPKRAPEVEKFFSAIFSGEKPAESAVPVAEAPLPVPAQRKKCLVLDLDETLWGGIVGEDGAGGIEVGEGAYPGDAFSFFQKKLVELAGSGVLLAIASKNNLADVEEVFEKRREMPLTLENFSAKKIDWRDKATQLREIAAELNIGADALVFVDNSPAERAWVKASLPEVETPEFPAHPSALPDFFARLLDICFRAETLTREDLAKTEHYRENRYRERFSEGCASHEDYLAALQMELGVACNDASTFPRVAQLSQKTNQFNLANRRFALADLEKMATPRPPAGARIYALAVRDIFGDSGICGEAVVVPATASADGAEPCAEIADFALSCRVLGRGIEGEFLKEILRRERALGTGKIFARFLCTQKNVPAKDFYADHGFEETAQGEFFLDLRSRNCLAPAKAIYKITTL